MTLSLGLSSTRPAADRDIPPDVRVVACELLREEIEHLPWHRNLGHHRRKALIERDVARYWRLKVGEALELLGSMPF